MYRKYNENEKSFMSTYLHFYFINKNKNVSNKGNSNHGHSQVEYQKVLILLMYSIYYEFFAQIQQCEYLYTL